MLYEAFIKAYTHAKNAVPYEIGGFLLGYVGRWKNQFYLMITHALPVNTKSSTITVEFLNENVVETLHQIRKIQNEYGYYIIGWYHSHPGYTCYPSRLDLKSHSTYFREKYQVGLIIDPVNDQHCIFRADNVISYDIIPFYVWRKR